MWASVEAEPQLCHSRRSLRGDSSPTCRWCTAALRPPRLDLHPPAEQGRNRLDRATQLRQGLLTRTVLSARPELRYLFPQATVPKRAPGSALSCLFGSSGAGHPTASQTAAPSGRGQGVCPKLPEAPSCCPWRCLTAKNHRYHKPPPRQPRQPLLACQQGLLLIVPPPPPPHPALGSAALFCLLVHGDKSCWPLRSVRSRHRAGFIAARGYRTTLRTGPEPALFTAQHQLWQCGVWISCRSKLIADGQQLSPRKSDFAATFLPLNLEWLGEWDALQQQDIPSLNPKAVFWLGLRDRPGRWEVACPIRHRSRWALRWRAGRCLAARWIPPPSTLPAAGRCSHAPAETKIEPLRQARKQPARPNG